MADDWEQLADSKAPVVIPVVKPNLNKWDGEDEEEEVKESWEEDEEKRDEEKTEIKMVKTKAKKKIADIIAEKERLKLEELERKKKLFEEEQEDELTPEQRIAEKLRLQKLQEEADLETALDTLGIKISNEKLTGIDAMNPTNKVEFTELSDAISKKVIQFKNKDEYPGFLEELIRSLCAHLSSIDIRKLKTTLDNLYLEKQKLEKEKTKKGKSKSKAGIRIERHNDVSANVEEYGFGEDYDYDDFM